MEITESPILVGRGHHCSVVLEDGTVSTTHAEFVRRAGVTYVKDLNSTNGTFVNGSRVNGERALSSGDSVQVGNTFFSFSSGVLSALPPQIPQTEYSNAKRTVDGTLTMPVVGAALPSSALPTRPIHMGKALSSWTTGLLWGSVGLIAALILSLVLTFVFFEQTMSGIKNGNNVRGVVKRWDNSEEFVVLSYVLWALLGIAVFVLLIVWTFRAHKATDTLEPGPRSWSRGWSVGAWFIPLANYILVPMVLSEVHKISHASRIEATVENGWRNRTAPGGLILWFVLYGVGGVLLGLGQIFFSDDFATENSYRVGLILMLAGAGAIAGACVLAINFINSVSRRLRSPQQAGF